MILVDSANCKFSSLEIGPNNSLYFNKEKASL